MRSRWWVRVSAIGRAALAATSAMPLAATPLTQAWRRCRTSVNDRQRPPRPAARGTRKAQHLSDNRILVPVPLVQFARLLDHRRAGADGRWLRDPLSIDKSGPRHRGPLSEGRDRRTGFRRSFRYAMRGAFVFASHDTYRSSGRARLGAANFISTLTKRNTPVITPLGIISVLRCAVPHRTVFCTTSARASSIEAFGKSFLACRRAVSSLSSVRTASSFLHGTNSKWSSPHGSTTPGP